MLLVAKFYILFTLNINFLSLSLLPSLLRLRLPYRRNKKKVSDVNDDVRRAAVTGIGFLLFR